MIGWLLARPRLWLYGVAGAAILGAVAWAGLSVRSAYRAKAALPIARAERDEARASLAAYQEAARLAAEVAGRVQTELDAERQRKARVVRVYRDAVSADPTCAAWAATPIGCPMVAPP